VEITLIPPNNGFEPQEFRYSYHDTWGFRTKCSGFTNNVYAFNHKIYCLTETWLNGANFRHNILPAFYSVFRADRGYLNSYTTSGDGVVFAVSNLLQGAMWRPDLETTKECVWIEIPASDNFNLLIGNQPVAVAERSGA
jgi:hypothetical protein